MKNFNPLQNNRRRQQQSKPAIQNQQSEIIEVKGEGGDWLEQIATTRKTIYSFTRIVTNSL